MAFEDNARPLFLVSVPTSLRIRLANLREDGAPSFPF